MCYPEYSGCEDMLNRSEYCAKVESEEADKTAPIFKIIKFEK